MKLVSNVWVLGFQSVSFVDSRSERELGHRRVAGLLPVKDPLQASSAASDRSIPGNFGPNRGELSYSEVLESEVKPASIASSGASNRLDLDDRCPPSDSN